MSAIGAIGPVAPTTRPAPAARPGTGEPGFAVALSRAVTAPATTRLAGTAGAPPAGAAAIPGRAGRAVLDVALLTLGRPATSGTGSPSAASGGRGGRDGGGAEGGAEGGAGGGLATGAGYVAGVYARLGVVLPGSTAEQARMGVAVPSLADARSGDLVVAGDPPQSGIYAGGGRMVVAPDDGGPVRLEPITGRVTTIRRIVREPASPVSGPAPSTLGGPVVGAPVAPTVGLSTAAASGSSGGLASVPFAELFQQAGARHGIDPALLAAVARVESGFRVDAVSPAGARGLMQFMPATAASLGVDPSDPASAIDGAARYLRQGLDRFGTTELALAAYNAGPGAVQRHGGIPPYAETRAYVRKVLDHLEQYR